MGDPITIGALGTLSQTLYDHLFKIVVEKANNTVKKPFVKRELKQALARTEERFKAITKDYEIYQAILALPLHDLPSVVDALSQFYDHPANPSLETTLNKRVSEVFHYLPEENTRESIANYLHILREELITVSPDYREKQGVLSSIRTENNTVYIASQLKDIFSLLANFIETNRKKEDFKEQLHRLQQDLRERKDLRKLLIAIDIAESYCTKLTLPPNLQDGLIEARKYYEIELQTAKLLWPEIQDFLDKLRSDKFTINSLHKKLARGETTHEFARENMETGEKEVVITSILKFAEQLDSEYKLSANNLTEIIQMRLFPLISEYPFFSAWALSTVIQQHLLDDFKDVLEQKLIITNQEIDRYERKVRGL